MLVPLDHTGLDRVAMEYAAAMARTHGSKPTCSTWKKASIWGLYKLGRRFE
jgi:hypothetical protein